jgi:hypothetical protein
LPYRADDGAATMPTLLLVQRRIKPTLFLCAARKVPVS